MSDDPFRYVAVLTDAETIAVGRCEFDALLRACAALTAPEPLEVRLNGLLTDARKLVRAQAGAIYVVTNGRLRFVCTQNEAHPEVCVIAEPLQDRPWAAGRIQTLPIDASSLAGYVALTMAPLRIDDAYEIAVTAPYRFDTRIDQATGFRSRAILAVPLMDRPGQVLGVLQVLNRLGDDGEPATFSPRDEQILMSMGSMAAVTVQNAQLHDQLLRSHMDTILRLATSAELRDDDTGQHIRRMSCYCEAIARQLGKSHHWCMTLLCASPMHDIGKIGVPDAILNKPGPLTQEERKVMQSHTVIGAQILEGSDTELLSMACGIARSHHERQDGAGYPDGLCGQAIPIEARIAAVADVFDALTNKRVYKPPFSLDNAMQIVRESRGTHFDPDVADAFLAIEDSVRTIFEAYQPV